MLEILEFIFSSFWIFLGFSCLWMPTVMCLSCWRLVKVYVATKVTKEAAGPESKTAETD